MAQSPAEIVEGPVLIGTMLNMALWGVCLVQVYLYQKSSWKDQAGIRIFIYLLFFAETLHTVLMMIFTYDGLVVNFGNVPSLETADWIGASNAALTGIIGGSVQMFLVRRLKILTRNWIIVTIVCICSVATILMGIATAAAIHFVPKYAEFRRFKVVVIIWLLSGTIADMVIAATLVIYLQKWRNTMTKVAKTNSYLDNIIRLTIQTGLLTSAWSIIDLVLFLANPTGLHLIFNLALSKLYSNSLMSSINARDFWKFDNSTQPGVQSVSGLRFSPRETAQSTTLSIHGTNTESVVNEDQPKTRNSVDLSEISLQERSFYDNTDIPNKV